MDDPQIYEMSGDVVDPYRGTARDGSNRELQPKQVEFMQSEAKYSLMGGSKGGGKSYACRAKAFSSNVLRPNIKGLVLRRSRDEVKKNFVEPMIEEVNGEIQSEEGEAQRKFLNHIDSKNVIWFPNGSRIDIGYCETKRDVSRYQGLEYDWICIEELTQWEESEFRKVMNSLRTRKRGVRPFFFGSCNPGDVGHAWVKRLFISQDYHDHENPDDYNIVRANVWDNQFLMDNDPEYVQNLMNLPEKDRRAYLYGDWDVFEGQYFSEYRESIHVTEPFMPLGVSKRIVAIDYGHKAPCAALWLALHTDGSVSVYRELYGPGMNYDQLAARIKAMTAEGEKIDYIVVDPAQIDKETEDTGTTLRKKFKAAGLPAVVKGINNRVEGWRTVRAYLTHREDPNSGQVFSLLRIGRNCKNLIRTFPDQIHDDRNPEDMNSKGEDHALDALRYGLMALGVNIGSMDDVERLNAMLSKNSRQMSPEESEKQRHQALDSSLIKPTDQDRSSSNRSMLDTEF